MRSLRHAFVMLLLSALAGAWAGCGSSEPLPQTATPEERFEAAKAIFDKGDYPEAITALRTITLQYSGTGVADDAQFLLGEAHFRRGEYLLASYEFGELRRLMPASPLVPDAQYRTAECYYMLSPKSSLDQQYTRKAIEELQGALENSPTHASAKHAGEMIRELTNRLAKKSFDTAELYARMEYWKASFYYYDDVIEKYSDTDYGPQAYLGKTRVLMARSRYGEALSTVNRFIELQPNSVLRGQADQLKGQIEAELAKVLGKPAGAVSPPTSSSGESR